MRKMKKFAEGGSDKYKAKYDRKIADIESDFAKAKAKGKNADVAKAKYEQRMADAKDDLAKWTGGDRTETRKLEKAAERNLSLTRRYGAPAAKPIETQGELKPKMSDTASILKGVATGPTATKTAAKPAAKPAAKADSGRSSTRADLEFKRTTERRQRIGEQTREANRAAQRRKVAGAPARVGYSSSTSPSDAAREARIQRAAARQKELLRGKGNDAKNSKSDFSKFVSGFLPVGKDDRSYKLAGNAPPGFKKGGSVDGCAIRGKTRAPMKKGK